MIEKNFFRGDEIIMRKVLIETERLILTTVEERDIEPLYKGCFSDWEVMKLLLSRIFSLEECRAYIENAFSKGQLMGFTVAIDKKSEEVIGYAGMFPYPFNCKDNEYEFGYILKQEAWKKGYATELSIGQIEALNKNFEDVSILATAHPKNVASKRVLKKVGMELIEASVMLENRGIRDIYKLLNKK